MRVGSRGLAAVVRERLELHHGPVAEAADLSTVRQPFEESGSLATRLLLEAVAERDHGAARSRTFTAGQGAADQAAVLGLQRMNLRHCPADRQALRVAGDSVAIDAYATNGAALEKSLRSLGATKVTRVGPLVSARVPIAALDKIAALSTLKYAKPVLAGSRVAVSQGDVTLKGPAARAGSGVDGTGVRVGLISDSYACNPAPFLPGAPTTTFEEDLANDVLEIITVFSARLYGSRSQRNQKLIDGMRRAVQEAQC